MGKRIVQKGRNPEYINAFSSALLDGFYLKEGETFDDALARAAEAFCFGDYDLAQRIYDAAWNGWFMFASPILSNAPKGSWKELDDRVWNEWFDINDETSYVTNYFNGEEQRGLPISCYSIVAPDTINGQMDAMKELASLSVSGGGVGIHNLIRATTDKAPGPIPFEKVLDGEIGYFKQGKTRRGACVYYMDVSHPDIIEHIRFRIPTGGDSKRKSDNLTQFHSGVNVTDHFMRAVVEDENFELICPHSGEIREVLRARDIWEEILETRALTGEPYIIMIDKANKAMPDSQKELGLKIHSSNLCSEIFLPTSEDRTFVCCLSSLNLEKYDEWIETSLIADLVTYLDNVIQWFIEKVPDDLHKARFSAYRERAIGIGTMGWHYYLQSKGISFEGGGLDSAIQRTHIMFSKIKQQGVEASEKLALERGEPLDMLNTGRRNSNIFAIAPNSNNAIILGTSPCIEPIAGNAYMHTTRAGSFLVKNPYLENLLEAIADGRSGDASFQKDIWLEEQWKSIITNDGSVQHLLYLSADEKKLFKTAYEIDQHWVIEQADARQQYICQGQSLNLFFPAEVDKSYYNSVHLKAALSEHVKGLYYSRTKTGISPAIVKEIEFKTLTDWSGDECVACEA